MVINRETAISPSQSTPLTFTISAEDAVCDKVNLNLETIESVDDRLVRRDNLNEAFRTLAEYSKNNNGKLPISLTEKLYTVLNTYAELVLYDQLNEGSFKESAILSEITLRLQVDELTNSEGSSIDWKNFSSIEDLIAGQSLQGREFVKGFENSILDAFNPVLNTSQHNEPLRTQVFKTLERIAYSYQNIREFNGNSEANRNFHANLDRLIYQVITPNPRLSANYEYNRAVFSVNLTNPADTDAKIANLDIVLAKFFSLDPETSYEYGSNFARVLNMKGIVLRDVDKAASKVFTEQAFNVRINLTPPENKKDRWNHFFLLSNIYSGRVSEALHNPRLTKEEFLKDVLPLAVLMQEFINASAAENKHPKYFDNHRLAIAKAEFGVQVFKVTQEEMQAVTKKLADMPSYNIEV